MLLTGISILNFIGVANAADNNSAVNQITSGLSGGGAGSGTMFNLAVKIFVVAFIAMLSVNILTGLVDGAKEMAATSEISAIFCRCCYMR